MCVFFFPCFLVLQVSCSRVSVRGSLAAWFSFYRMKLRISGEIRVL